MLQRSLLWSFASIVVACTTPPGNDGGADAATTETMSDAGPLRVVQISAGGIQHSCALLSNGRVKCWGSGEYGQNGVPSAVATSRCTATLCGSPVEFPCDFRAVEVPNLTDVAEIATGSAFTCARKLDGTVWCWGYNSTGQLGNGEANEQPHDRPTQVTGVANAVQITARSENACARLADGSVMCWGSNRYGQLGSDPAVGTMGCTYAISCFDTHTEKCGKRAVVVPGLTQVDDVRLGRYYLVARRGESILALGANDVGQSGNAMSDTNAHFMPITTTMTGMTSLVAGGSHACAVFSDKTAKCWGYNEQGQLGDAQAGITTCMGRDYYFGDPTMSRCRLAPTAVMNLTDVQQISAGRYHTCAIVGTGAVKCWGANNYGQCGNGPPGPGRCSVGPNEMGPCETTPVNVMGITDAVQISAGDYQVCALLQSGEVRCWGGNTNGQLGDGSRTDQRIPVSVLDLP